MLIPEKNLGPTGSTLKKKFLSQENPLIDFIVRYSRRTAGELGPLRFVREVLGADPDAWQVRALKAYGRGERRISVRSGHGVGKTTFLAWILLHHALTEFPQKAVCTAPTSAQLFDALAAETKAWFKRLPEQLKPLFEIKSDRIELVAAPEESFISFRTSSADKPEALAGVHAENVLIVADEASGIPEAIYEAAAGGMSTHGATTVLAGNPVRGTGLFYDTHHILSDSWYTIHASCEESRFVTKDFIRDMELRYGRDSNAFRVRVLGDFPLGDDDVVIAREVAEPALTRDVQPQRVGRVWGVDPARFGSDATAWASRQGNALTDPTEEKRGYDTMQVVGWIKAKWDACNPSLRPAAIMVDAIGIGAGVADRLRELGLPAFDVMVSESAPMKDQFQRLRDEMWFNGQDWINKRNCILHGTTPEGVPWKDTRLLNELCAPTFTFTSNGKRVVESKDRLKKRLPRIGSPNRADAFLMTLLHDAGIASGGGASVKWNEPISFKLKSLM